MQSPVAVAMLSALAHEARLSTFRLLVQAGPEGLPAGVLAEALGVVPSTLSFHLKDLRMAGLVEARREGRSIIYVADLDAVGVLLRFLAEDCCGGHPEQCGIPPVSRAVEEGVMTGAPDKVYNVLFLCTGNSARSIMAECLLNREGAGRFRAYSAGSHPRGAVHPQTLRLLRQNNVPTEGLRSKSWEEFTRPDAPRMDFVFTVCDDAAAEACPTWPGQPVTAHWGVPDPVRCEGDEVQTALVFADVFRMLYNRIAIFTCLPIESLDRLSLRHTLEEIGRKGREKAVQESGDGDVHAV